MVVGVRMLSFATGSFRRFHQLGNHLVASLISRLFSVKVTDVLSGYRVFSRPFVKTVPLMSEGFEIETEMTLQALAKRFVIKELPIVYGRRPEGSRSKLDTWSDGYLVLKSIAMTAQEYAQAPIGGRYLAYQVEGASVQGLFATVKVRVLVQQILPISGRSPALAPQAVIVEDGWIRIAGTWYRRLEDGPKSGEEAKQP